MRYRSFYDQIFFLVLVAAGMFGVTAGMGYGASKLMIQCAT